MSSWLDWTIEDDYGDNPTSRAGVFEFQIWYEIDPGDPGIMYTRNGDGYPGYAASATFVDATCVEVCFNDENTRRPPTPEENSALSEWCLSYLDAHPKECGAVCERAFEYSYIEPDYDDVND